MKKKLLALIVALALTVTALAACGKKTDTPDDGKTTGGKTTEDNSQGNTDSPDSPESNGPTLPLTEEDVTLSLFIGMDANLATAGKSFEDIDYFKEMEKRTGVHIKFEVPATGEETTAFNLMIASGNLTDLISNTSNTSYPDGLDAAVEDGYYLDLTPYMNNLMADYNKLRTKDSFFEKSTITDSGRIVGAYQIFRTPQGPWCGPQLRKDWLDDLNLEVPVTYDDWENMLTKFKEEKGAYAPLSLGSLGYNIMTHSMSAGFGAICDFMNVNGTVEYGPISDGWKEYLMKMHDWYAKGLIDPDFMTTSTFMPDMGMVTTGQTGAWDSMYTMPSLYEASSTDPNMYIIPVSSPVKNEGDEVHIRLQDSILGAFVSISADTKYPELCAEWINYMCTEEGSLLQNYGIEGGGLAYDAEGNPTLSDLVINNPDGLSVSQAMAVYTMPPAKLAGHYDWTREMVIVPEKDKAAYEVWGAVSDDYIMPAGLTHTGDESKDLAAIVTDITTFVNESTSQFITGVKDLNTEWDSYVSTIEGMDIKRAVEIKQAALDRFNAR